MTITCPNCRNDFRTGKLSTEKVNVVLCPHCRMVFPYTVKKSAAAEKSNEALEPVLAAVAVEPPKQKKFVSLLGNAPVGGEDFLRLKELEEKRELLRRERELRYEQMALEYRIKLIEEKERLELREAERRRALQEMEGFVRVGAVSIPAEAAAEAVEPAPVQEVILVEDKPQETVPPEPASLTEEEIIVEAEQVTEPQPAQVAFRFDKTPMVQVEVETAVQEKEPPLFEAPEAAVEAAISEALSDEAAEELKLYEDAETEMASEDISAETQPSDEEFQIAEEMSAIEEASAIEETPEPVLETVLELATEGQVELEGEQIVVAVEMTEEQAEEPPQLETAEFESEEEEYETVVVEVEEDADEAEEVVAEVRLVDDEAEDDFVVQETRLIEEEPVEEPAQPEAQEGESAKSLSEVEAVIERMRLIEEEAHAHDLLDVEESFVEPVEELTGKPVVEEMKPADVAPVESSWYASGETVTEHGIARVIVTGVKLLDEEAPPEETKDASVERFFAQVEDEAESVSDSELEESLKADVDQVVSEIEDMGEQDAVQPAYFEPASEDTNIIMIEQPAAGTGLETAEEKPGSEPLEPLEPVTPEHNIIEIQPEPDKVSQMTRPAPEPEPVFVAQPVEMSSEEIQLRQEQEKSRRRATQQFYSSQFQNIKMQRDIERRIQEEKERLAAEAAEQKNPAGTELSRVKRNLQIGAAIFGILIIAQILIYLFGGGQ